MIEPLRTLPLAWPVDRMAQVAAELVLCDRVFTCYAQLLAEGYAARFGFVLTPAQAGIAARMAGIKTKMIRGRTVFRLREFVVRLAAGGEGVPLPVNRPKKPSERLRRQNTLSRRRGRRRSLTRHQSQRLWRYPALVAALRESEARVRALAQAHEACDTSVAGRNGRDGGTPHPEG